MQRLQWHEGLGLLPASNSYLLDDAVAAEPGDELGWGGYSEVPL